MSYIRVHYVCNQLAIGSYSLAGVRRVVTSGIEADLSPPRTSLSLIPGTAEHVILVVRLILIEKLLNLPFC